MGRRKRRKVVKKVIRKIPKIFICPHCGKQSVFVNLSKIKEIALVKCTECNLSAEVTLRLGKEPVDAYNEFIDLYYKGEI